MFKKIFVSSLLSFSLLFAPSSTQAALPSPVEQKFIRSPSDLCDCDTNIEFLYYRDLIYNPLCKLVNSLKEANVHYPKLRKQILDIAYKTKSIPNNELMPIIYEFVAHFSDPKFVSSFFNKPYDGDITELLRYMNCINKQIGNLQYELISLTFQELFP